MRLQSRWSLLGSSLAVALAIVASPAAAQQPDFAEGAAGAPAAPTDDIDLNLTAGGTLAYGNSRTFGLNVAGNLTIHEAMELFVADVSFVYGIAATPLTCGDVQSNPAGYAMGTVDFCGLAGTGMDAEYARPASATGARTRATSTGAFATTTSSMPTTPSSSRTAAAWTTWPASTSGSGSSSDTTAS